MTELHPFRNEKAERVHRFFNEVAHQYDFMNTLLSGGIHHIWKKQAIDMAGLKDGYSVIDMCGGTGDLAVLAAQKVGARGQVVLYDFNREMMEAGRRKYFDRRIRQRIIYIQGDAQCAGIKENSFNAALVGFGIRNLDSIEKGFREMHRVLKPGGRLICLEFSQPDVPIFRFFYDLYSYLIMPMLGQVITGSKQAYSYLCESIRQFPSPEALKSTLITIGFSEVEYRKLTNGIAVIHTAKKSDFFKKSDF